MQVAKVFVPLAFTVAASDSSPLYLYLSLSALIKAIAISSSDNGQWTVDSG